VRALVLHPRHWADKRLWPKGVEVRHVAIGGETPRRSSGAPTLDGVGDVATEDGKRALLNIAREWVPDVFMFGIHIRFDRDTVKAFKRLCPKAKVVMWYTDQRPSISKFIKEHLGLLDALLVTNRDAADHKMYVRDIPQVITFYDGVDPDEYWPKPVRPTYDCFFGGNNFWVVSKEMKAARNNSAPWIDKFVGAKFRDEFLRAVAKQFRLKVRGEWGWTGFPVEVDRPAFDPHYVDAMREARIVLNTVNVPRYGLLTRRFFRSIASGRLFMTEYTPGLEDAFKNHRHMVWFHEVEEGLDLIRYYLDHDDERERIAVEGRRLILAKHTWKHRLAEFARIMGNVI